MDYRLFKALLRVGALYATATAAAHFFVRWYRPAASDPTISALLGLPLACSLGYLVGSRRYFQEERLILRSVMRPKLKDGERVVVIGPIEPLAPALRAPITGRDCVAYEYVIDHESPGVDGPPTRVRDYWGMAVSPYQISTPAGPVRVLAWAKLEQPSFVATEDEAYASAAAHLYATSYRHPASAGEKYGSLAEPLDTESDTFADDICADSDHLHLRRDSAAELRKLQVAERRLEVGETVCAAGSYSAAKKALVPTSKGLKPLRISTYRPENWAAENREWGMTYVRWGVGIGILTIGLALATRWC